MKRFLILISISFCLLANLFSQNPGNVGTANLTAWFKPDNLVLGNVTAWTTTFPVGAAAITVNDNAAPYPVATNIPAGYTSNYNTTIEFNANSNAAIKALQNTNNLNLLDNRNSTSQGTFFAVYYFPTYIRNNNHMMLYNETSGDAIQLRNLGGSGRLALGRGLGVNVNATRNWIENNTPTIISTKGNRGGAGTMFAYENSSLFITSSASQSSGQIGLHFGLMPGNANSPYNGYLSEFIFYNTDLSAVDMNKVHSYLAIKYGITLDDFGGGIQGDYLSTDGALIWDATVSPNYHNDVIGIGRDDNQALLQKQSHSFDDVTRIYIDALQTNNASNIGVFNNDTSYVMIGDNGGLLCNTLATGSELPPAPLFNSRIEREWKVTKTNFSQTFNCDITISPCAIGIDFDTTCLALLVDDDGDFTNATAYNSTSGLVFTKVGNTISISGISNLHIPNNSIRYITLASVTFTKELGNDTIKCEGDSIVLDAGNDGANYLWNTGGTTKTIKILNPGSYWVRVESNRCFEYDTILVSDQQVTASFTSPDTEGCIPLTSNFTDLSFVNFGSITNWNWNFGNGNTSTNQNPTNTYVAAGSYTVSLSVTSDLGCIDDSVINGYIDAYSLAVADFSFSPSFGAPRDVITFTNSSSNAVSYKWYFGDGDSSILVNPVHSYLEEGTYIITLIAINVNGCNDTVTSSIEIKSDNYFAPNSFTPDDDGVNDEWRIIGLEESEFYTILIFNRWGEIVFESTDPTESWDGKYLGEFCMTDTYIWKVKFKTEGVTINEYTGHINLMR